MSSAYCSGEMCRSSWIILSHWSVEMPNFLASRSISSLTSLRVTAIFRCWQYCVDQIFIEHRVQHFAADNGRGILGPVLAGRWRRGSPGRRSASCCGCAAAWRRGLAWHRRRRTFGIGRRRSVKRTDRHANGHDGNRPDRNTQPALPPTVCAEHSITQHPCSTSRFLPKPTAIRTDAAIMGRLATRGGNYRSPRGPVKTRWETAMARSPRRAPELPDVSPGNSSQLASAHCETRMPGLPWAAGHP